MNVDTFVGVMVWTNVGLAAALVGLHFSRNKLVQTNPVTDPVKSNNRFTERFENRENAEAVARRVQHYVGHLRNATVHLSNVNVRSQFYVTSDTGILPVRFSTTPQGPPQGGPQGFRTGNAFGQYVKEMELYSKWFRQAFARTPRVLFLPGDVAHARDDLPFVAKTRPVDRPGQTLILPLNVPRHWAPVRDIPRVDIPFGRKKDAVVWRGAATGRDKRVSLVETYHDYPENVINVGFTQTDPSYAGTIEACMLKPKMTIEDQLRYKFIISVEGNDVASNLKWILASRSVCIKPHARMESWLMESKLVPWEHYVPVKDDFSDLVDVFQWCVEHPDMCERIADNANAWMRQFGNPETERKIVVDVLKAYTDHVTVI